MDIQTIFEKGRSVTIQFELSELLKTKVDSSIINNIKQKNRLLGDRLEKVANVKSKHDILELKKFTSVYKTELEGEFYDCLLSEIREIADDYKWKNSKEGLFILRIEDWIINARKLAIQKFPHHHIYIGRSNWEPKKIVIGICVKDKCQRINIENFFQNLSPPSQVEFPIKENSFK